jgi:ribonuclease Z
MKVSFLGTAGAISSAGREHTSLAISSASTVLVDCCGNPARALASAGIPWSGLAHVILTHRHADHVAGLPSLIRQIDLATRQTGRGELTVWGLERALDVAQEHLSAVGLLEKRGLFTLRWQPLSLERTTLTMGDLTVTAFAVEHGEVPTLGLRLAPVAHPELALVYSADTEPCPAVWDCARDARLLVHECSSFDEPLLAGHSTLPQLEPRFAATPRPAVRLVHLPPSVATKGQRVSERLAKAFGSRVSLAYDGLQEQL